MARDAYQRRLYRTSGQVRSADPLVCFLYLLMRDQRPVGEVHMLVDQAMAELAADDSFTNGYLGKYSKHLARRLRRRAR